MELILKGILENLYLAKDYTNKKTGEVRAGKWTAQFMERVKTEEGEQLVIHKVTIPQEKLKEYSNKIGELVEIPVRAYSINGQIGFSGI